MHVYIDHVLVAAVLASHSTDIVYIVCTCMCAISLSVSLI